MNKIYLFLLLTFTSYTFSQEYTAEQRANFANMIFNVSGIVTDSETSEPLEYATISLKHKRIPDKIFGGVTDENGKFSVDVNPGMYNVKIDYIDNIITGDYLDFSMIKNLLIISRNVVYKNLDNIMKADVIKLDTTTKDTKIFMYNSNEQVNVTNIK